MTRDILTTLRHLGIWQIVLLLGVCLAGSAVLSYLETVGSGVWLAVNLMIGHMVSRAAAQGQSLATAQGPFRHMLRYVLANLWVYGLALLALLPVLMVAASALYASGQPPETLALPLILAVIAVISGSLALFGTALPAAVMGAPYGLPTALRETLGQRWALFRALLLGPGAINAANVVLVLVWRDTPTMLESVAFAALETVCTTLGLILTATILAVGWRRRNPPAALAEVFA